jgi:hypothetical protein
VGLLLGAALGVDELGGELCLVSDLDGVDWRGGVAVGCLSVCGLLYSRFVEGCCCCGGV